MDEPIRVLKAAAAAPPPSPWLSGLASFLLPGAGQAFNGQFWLGTLLLVLSFVSLPAGTMGFVRLSRGAAWTILVVLFLPWVYSIVQAARRTAQLADGVEPFQTRRAMLRVLVLLVVVFPIVAFAFCLLTLFLLLFFAPDALDQLVNFVERFRRAIGLSA